MAKLSPDDHLSGSVLPAWLGKSPWQTPLEVLQRARESKEGIEPPPLDSLAADIGTAAEPVIIARGLRLLGLDPDKVTNYQENGEVCAKKHKDMELYYSDDGLFHMEQPKTIYTNESDDIHVINKDGELTLSGTIVIEAKFTSAGRKADDPQLYRGPIQLQAGMMCHDADYGVLFTCYSGRTLTAHVFPRHQATVDAITTAVIHFEKHMQFGTDPEPVNSQEMAAQFHDIEEERIELPPELIESVTAIDEINQSIKIHQSNKETHNFTLMQAMGNHSKAEIVDPANGNKFNLSWPIRHSKGKPAECCPKCNHEIKPATPPSEARQKSVTIRKVK